LPPILTPDEYGASVARGEIFERGGWIVQSNRKLGQVIRRRPAGITANQWNCAIRTHVAFVVWDARTHTPVFAAEFRDPDQRVSEAERTDRMTNAVCEAVGLGLLRIESSALGLRSHAKRVIEYVIDARAFMDATAEQEETSGLPSHEPLSYRYITGRLPDGRTGFVNDLGVVARVAAEDAYVNGQVADPIIRGLRVRWKDGPAEGWGWLEMRYRLCIHERTRIWQQNFSCGVDPARLAEDLAVAAIGERLKALDTVEPPLRGKKLLGSDFDELRLRRDDMESRFEYDHLSFD
jgi:hypothetical protein